MITHLLKNLRVVEGEAKTNLGYCYDFFEKTGNAFVYCCQIHARNLKEAIEKYESFEDYEETDEDDEI